MLSMFVWALLTLIYPSASAFTINQLWSAKDKREAVYSQIEQIWDRFEKERKDFLKNDPVKGEGRGLNMSGSHSASNSSSSNSTTLEYVKVESANWGRISKESEVQVSYVKAYYQFLEPLRISTAERAWLVRQKALEDTFVRKAKVARRLMRLSPAAVYDLATEALAETDLREIEHFITTVQQYRGTLIEYFHDKGAFSSRQWFASDKEPVNWDDLPLFSYRRVSAWESVKYAAPDLALLLLINLVLFMATGLIFVKQDV